MPSTRVVIIGAGQAGLGGQLPAHRRVDRPRGPRARPHRRALAQSTLGLAAAAHPELDEPVARLVLPRSDPDGFMPAADVAGYLDRLRRVVPRPGAGTTPRCCRSAGTVADGADTAGRQGPVPGRHRRGELGRRCRRHRHRLLRRAGGSGGGRRARSVDSSGDPRSVPEPVRAAGGWCAGRRCLGDRRAARRRTRGRRAAGGAGRRPAHPAAPPVPGSGHHVVAGPHGRARPAGGSRTDPPAPGALAADRRQRPGSGVPARSTCRPWQPAGSGLAEGLSASTARRSSSPMILRVTAAAADATLARLLRRIDDHVAATGLESEVSRSGIPRPALCCRTPRPRPTGSTCGQRVFDRCCGRPGTGGVTPGCTSPCWTRRGRSGTPPVSPRRRAWWWSANVGRPAAAQRFSTASGTTRRSSSTT